MGTKGPYDQLTSTEQFRVELLYSGTQVMCMIEKRKTRKRRIGEIVGKIQKKKAETTLDLETRLNLREISSYNIQRQRKDKKYGEEGRSEIGTLQLADIRNSMFMQGMIY